jgi:DNA-binding NarL/FixJ family response regulator
LALGIDVNRPDDKLLQIAAKWRYLSLYVEDRFLTTEIPLAQTISIVAKYGYDYRQRSALSTKGHRVYKVLIAVENEAHRNNIRVALRAVDDLQVCGEAITGLDAVEKANRYQADLVILGWRLAGPNALEAARRIRTARELTNVLILAGRHTSRQFVSKTLRVGARACISREEISLLVTAIQSIRNGEVYVSPAVLAASGTTTQEKVPLSESEGSELTPREVEVLRLVATGSKIRESAEALHVSAKTIEAHRTNIRRKLGLESVADLVRYAISHHIA